MNYEYTSCDLCANCYELRIKWCEDLAQHKRWAKGHRKRWGDIGIWEGVWRGTWGSWFKFMFVDNNGRNESYWHQVELDLEFCDICIAQSNKWPIDNLGSNKLQCKVKMDGGGEVGEGGILGLEWHGNWIYPHISGMSNTHNPCPLETTSQTSP